MTPCKCGSYKFEYVESSVDPLRITILCECGNWTGESYSSYSEAWSAWEKENGPSPEQKEISELKAENAKLLMENLGFELDIESMKAENARLVECCSDLDSKLTSTRLKLDECVLRCEACMSRETKRRIER